ncbi:hypothetical protein FKM82_013311 [Ascaphus truei]
MFWRATALLPPPPLSLNTHSPPRPPPLAFKNFTSGWGRPMHEEGGHKSQHNSGASAGEGGGVGVWKGGQIGDGSEPLQMLSRAIGWPTPAVDGYNTVLCTMKQKDF